MADEFQAWLSPEEIVFHRMSTFHRQRVEELARGEGPIRLRDNRLLIVNMFSEQTIRSRTRFEAFDLKKHGGMISPLGDRGGGPKFNADGFLNVSVRRDGMSAYSQLFRDGRLESVMTDSAYKQDGTMVLRTSICEQAFVTLVPSFVKFCVEIGLSGPVWLFGALTGCAGCRLPLHPRAMVLTEDEIDRQILWLPEMAFSSTDKITPVLLRPLFDSLWQAAGVERSPNFDDEGEVWRPS